MQVNLQKVNSQVDEKLKICKKPVALRY